MIPISAAPLEPTGGGADFFGVESVAGRPEPTLQLRCAHVHPVDCAESWLAASSADLVTAACRHGALAHGFTPVWYSPQRLALIAAAVQQRHC